ncbi:glutamate decarboxylase, partial [Enterococcus sp. LJL99]
MTIVDGANEPFFGTVEATENVILKKLRLNPVESKLAYRLIKDQLIDEGNARQNMATFCQTYMEPEAQQLMAETFEKNAIDKSEY